MAYFIIHNGTLIDGTGSKPIKNAAIIIKDNKIEYAGPEDALNVPYANIPKIDAEGGFMLPGFIDTHLHIMNNGFHMEDTMYNPLSLFFYNGLKNMRLTTNAGVTTVRDAGLADYGVKMAVENGLITGPRMQISITPLSITGGHFDFWLKSGFDMKISYPGYPDSICNGIDDVRRKVREVMRAGAEVIKVMATGGVMSANDSPEHPQFSMEEFRVIIEEARTRGLKTMAHAHGAEGIKNAVKAGIDSIEHGTYIDEESIEMVLEKSVYLIPTLITQKYNRIKAESGSLEDYRVDDAIRIADIHRENIERAYKTGVTMVMGTDCGVIDHGVNLQELGLLCDIGMKPMDAIMSGTKVAAECLGWQNKIGTIEAGKLADVVISKKDPLSDIYSLGNPDNIEIVIKGGKMLKNIRKH